MFVNIICAEFEDWLQVTAVDGSKFIADVARDVIQENGREDVIEVVQGILEDLTPPSEADKADVLVRELIVICK